MVLSYRAADFDAGRTVYSILRRELSASAGLIRRLKRSGAILVDGVPAFTNRPVAPGETVAVDLSAAEPECDIVPEAGPLDIIYEDEWLIAVSKPAGQITHPSRSRYTGTLANYVSGHLKAATGDGRCHAVGRLDRDTSGVVLFAKSGYVKTLAAKSLSSPDALKEYLAAVCGAPAERSGVIDLPIRRLREGDMLRVVSPDGQRAVTRFETLATQKAAGQTIALLRLRLETGRTHQIRVHCLAAGHPILGDRLYSNESSRLVSEELCVYGQALHAIRLKFAHPVSGRELELFAGVPDVFPRLFPGVF